MKKNWILWSLLGYVLLALPACKDDDTVDLAEALRALLAKQDQEIADYLDRNGIAKEKDDLGIYREVLKLDPDGEVIEEGDVVLLHYRISRLDGTLIGTSEGGDPVLVTYDPSRSYVPRTSFFRGLRELKVGDRYRFYAPSPYAYGAFTDGDKIPENSIIVLELEAVDVYHSLEEIFDVEQAEIAQWIEAENLSASELPGGLHKVELQAGIGEPLVTGDTAQVYYKGYYLSKEVFDENLEGDTFDFKLGANSVVQGFEQAVRSMQIGEKALFILPSQLAYGRSGVFAYPREYFEDFKRGGLILATASPIPPFSTLVFEIELVSKK
jgi:FKBP-type peptidyl-prolyl cis-trans isomerase FkpA